MPEEQKRQETQIPDLMQVPGYEPYQERKDLEVHISAGPEELGESPLGPVEAHEEIVSAFETGGNIPVVNQQNSDAKNKSRRISIAAIIAILVLLSLISWPQLFDRFYGPVSAPGELRLWLLVPGQYSICIESNTVKNDISEDEMLKSDLQLEIAKDRKSIAVTDRPTPGKYGDFFPFEDSRPGPRDSVLHERPIRCFIANVPGEYILKARLLRPEQSELKSVNLTVKRDPDILSVLPCLPFFILLLLIPVALVLAVCAKVVRFQPRMGLLRFAWNRILCVSGVLLMAVGLLFGAGAAAQLLEKQIYPPKEILLGGLILLGVVPVSCGAILSKLQLKRLWEEDGQILIYRRFSRWVWKGLMWLLAATMLISGIYGVLVCSNDLRARAAGMPLPWGAPPDVLCSILMCSCLIGLSGGVIVLFQLRSLLKRVKRKN